MSLRDRILAKNDSPTEQVLIPEWGETVTVRSLTAHEQERWWDILTAHSERGVEPPGGRKASFVYMACLGEDGTELFKPEDIPTLGQKHPAAINRLFDAIQRLSGMTKEVQAEVEKKPDAQTSSSSTSSLTGSSVQT
jgi:hypothetical protein